MDYSSSLDPHVVQCGLMAEPRGYLTAERRLVNGYQLFVIRYWLLVTRCSSFFARCFLGSAFRFLFGAVSKRRRKYTTGFFLCAFLYFLGVSALTNAKAQRCYGKAQSRKSIVRCFLNSGFKFQLSGFSSVSKMLNTKAAAQLSKR